MTVDLLRPPTQLTHAEAVQASQQAPGILQRDTSWNIPWPLSLLVASDAPEKWSIYENLLLSCLRTGDNASAKACLDKLKARFGEQNERVTGLMGLYYEAVGNNGELEQFLRQYEKKMTDSPTNMVRKTNNTPSIPSDSLGAGCPQASRCSAEDTWTPGRRYCSTYRFARGVSS